MEFKKDFNKVSYLRARDPSILAWGTAKIDKLRCNLESEMNTLEESEIIEKTNHLEVFLRIKRSADNAAFEHNKSILRCKLSENSKRARNIRDGGKVTKLYTFSKIFPGDTTQVELFNCIVKPRMLNFINGENSNLLSYGTSGAGKTFTMMGTATEPGLIPRSLEYLFKTLPHCPKHPNFMPNFIGGIKILNEIESNEQQEILLNILNNTNTSDLSIQKKTYKAMQQRLSQEPSAILEENHTASVGVWVSFAEIYNENVYDLLDTQSIGAKIRKKLIMLNNNGCTYIKNLKHVYVSNGLDAYQVMQFGLLNLRYASTSLNPHSSRSHCIFTISLVQTNETFQNATISQFNFCDLAGSERSKTTNNKGERLKESNNINSSLLVLGRCIKSIRKCQKNNDKQIIPFRESKLTQLFQKALSGQEDILMIVNINPETNMVDESIHVLNFSAIAQDILIEQAVNENEQVKKNDRFSQYLNKSVGCINRDKNNEKDNTIERLQRNIEELYLMLEQIKIEKLNIEEETRNELVTEFEKILEGISINKATEMESKNQQIEDLENEIQQLKQQMYSNDSSVISLDSSDCSFENKQKCKKCTSCKSNDENMEKIMIMKLEQNTLKKEIEKLKLILEDKDKENTELQKTLQDAAIQFTQKERECHNLEIIKIKQQEELLKLEEELQVYIQSHQELLLQRDNSEESAEEL